jgi:hypothetical protein
VAQNPLAAVFFCRPLPPPLHHRAPVTGVSGVRCSGLGVGCWVSGVRVWNQPCLLTELFSDPISARTDAVILSGFQGLVKGLRDLRCRPRGGWGQGPSVKKAEIGRNMCSLELTLK